MSRRCFAFGRIALLGLALGMETSAQDVSKNETDAATREKNAAIFKKLEAPIPLKVKELLLKAVFDHVKQATIEQGDEGVPIDVDQADLAKARVTLETPVSYQSKEGQSMMTSLREMLGRINLKPEVEHGSLRISWTRQALLDRGPQTKAILDKLEAEVDLAFEKTSLKDALKQVHQALNKGLDGKKVPIYVDPMGMQEAGTSLETPISFVAIGEPLKDSLRRMLNSIGLTYVVKDGLLSITSQE